MRFFTTALGPDEILTEIRIPSVPSGSGGAYLKIERKVGDYAAAAIACQLNIDFSGSIQNIGIGLTNVGPTPIRASGAEQLLKGKNPSDSVVEEAGQLSSNESEPVDDLRGSAEYKRALVDELTQRAIKLSLQRAEGSR